MSAFPTIGLAFLAAGAHFAAGLMVLMLLERIDRVYAITCRWNEPTEYAAVVLWPLSVPWLLWRAVRHGRS